MAYWNARTPNAFTLVFKIYDTDGLLLELTDVITPKLSTRWRAIHAFLNQCGKTEVREVSVSKGGKNFPSLVACNGNIQYRTPIRANLEGIL